MNWYLFGGGVFLIFTSIYVATTSEGSYSSLDKLTRVRVVSAFVVGLFWVVLAIFLK